MEADVSAGYVRMAKTSLFGGGKKLNRSTRHRWTDAPALAGLLLVGLLIAGCGAGLGSGLITQPLLVAECADPVDDASVTKDIVVLNWDRGSSPIYPDYEFEGLDLTQLELLDGGTVADDGARFRERVRDEVARILYDRPGLSVEISWSPSASADGYRLYYAPYPYAGPTSIGSVDVGNETQASYTLWEGASYYVAVTAYDETGESRYSNTELFLLGPYTSDHVEGTPELTVETDALEVTFVTTSPWGNRLVRGRCSCCDRCFG